MKAPTNEHGRQRALIVTFGQYKFDGTEDRLRVKVQAGTCRSGITDLKTLRYVSYDEEFKGVAIPSAGLQDLEITALARREDNGAAWSMDAEYKEVHDVNLGRAQVMVKTLQTIQKGLERAEREDGYHESFGQYVARLAKIMSVAHVFILRQGQTPRSGSYESSMDQYTLAVPGYAAQVINSRMVNWAAGQDERAITY